MAGSPLLIVPSEESLADEKPPMAELETSREGDPLLSKSARPIPDPSVAITNLSAPIIDLPSSSPSDDLPSSSSTEDIVRVVEMPGEEKQFYLEVEVFNPVRVKDPRFGVTSHTEYTIRTETNLPSYQGYKLPLFVSRRFNDFKWLHDELCKSGNFVCVLPEENSITAMWNSEKFGKERIKGLQAFLNNVAEHTELRECYHFRTFLSSELNLTDPTTAQNIARGMLEFIVPQKADCDSKSTVAYLGFLGGHLLNAETMLEKAVEELNDALKEMESSIENCNHLEELFCAESFQSFKYGRNVAGFISGVLKGEARSLKEITEILHFFKSKIDAVEVSFEQQDKKRRRIIALNKNLEARKVATPRNSGITAGIASALSTFTQKNATEVMSNLKKVDEEYQAAKCTITKEFTTFEKESFEHMRLCHKALLESFDGTRHFLDSVIGGLD